MHIFLEEIFLKTLAKPEEDLNHAHDDFVASVNENREMTDGSEFSDALKIYAICFALSASWMLIFCLIFLDLLLKLCFRRNTVMY